MFKKIVAPVKIFFKGLLEDFKVVFLTEYPNRCICGQPLAMQAPIAHICPKKP